MLVGDRGQPGQAHQVFVTGVRIVHPRVVSVGGQVLHRLQQCSAGCVGDRLATTSSDRSARISETLLGAQKVRSNPCSPRSPNARPCAPSERSPRQASAPLPVRRRPRRHAIGQPDQGGGYVGVACEQPCWGAGFAFGVVLPQAATCALVPTRRIRRPGRCQCSS